MRVQQLYFMLIKNSFPLLFLDYVKRTEVGILFGDITELTSIHEDMVIDGIRVSIVLRTHSSHLNKMVREVK